MSAPKAKRKMREMTDIEKIQAQRNPNKKKIDYKSRIKSKGRPRTVADTNMTRPEGKRIQWFIPHLENAYVWLVAVPPDYTSNKLMSAILFDVMSPDKIGMTGEEFAALGKEEFTEKIKGRIDEGAVHDGIAKSFRPFVRDLVAEMHLALEQVHYDWGVKTLGVLGLATPETNIDRLETITDIICKLMMPPTIVNRKTGEHAINPDRAAFLRAVGRYHEGSEELELMFEEAKEQAKEQAKAEEDIKPWEEMRESAASELSSPDHPNVNEKTELAPGMVVRDVTDLPNEPESALEQTKGVKTLMEEGAKLLQALKLHDENLDG